MQNKLAACLLIASFCYSMTDAKAQMFKKENSSFATEENISEPYAPASKEIQTDNKNDVSNTEKQENISDDAMQDLDMTEEEQKEVFQRLKKQLNPRIKDGDLVVNPIDLGETADGSERGTVAFISTDGDEDLEDGNIFLYYSDFQISRNKAIGIGCRLRFHIVNGLNRRVSNVSVKLVWPGLNTPLSFENINPNTENYYDYALFGEGCYNMDKIPNIVVNRCRVKGMTQAACANRIRWLSKSQ